MQLQANKRIGWVSGCILVLTTVLSQSAAQASVVGIGVGDFDAGSSLITFTSVSSGTDVNFVLTGGVQFGYTGGVGSVAVLGTGAGPGNTNNIDGSMIVSTGNNQGYVTLALPGLSTQFGYGFSVFSTSPLAIATSIFLFDGLTQVGTLSYSGSPDPTFTGGFAGIESTIAFNNVWIGFNSAQASAFAMDNVRFNTADTSSSVPEPASLALMGLGLSGLLLTSSKRRKQ